MKYAKHLALILFSLICARPLCAQPIQVSIEKVGVGFKLTRAGQRYLSRVRAEALPNACCANSAAIPFAPGVLGSVAVSINDNPSHA